MKISYICEHCGTHIDDIDVEAVDEAKFGFDCLTAEERGDIIKHDSINNIMYVYSICDDCIRAIGLSQDLYSLLVTKYIH